MTAARHRWTGPSLLSPTSIVAWSDLRYGPRRYRKLTPEQIHAVHALDPMAVIHLDATNLVLTVGCSCVAFNGWPAGRHQPHP